MRIVGTSGSGKSHLARRVSRRLGVPWLELDAVFWDAGWTLRELDDAQGIVADFLRTNPRGWVIDGNWTTRVGGLFDGEHAPDVTVWLDHSRLRTTARVVRRTVARGIRRQELWNGNREHPRDWFRRDPERNVMRWAWVDHPRTRAAMWARIAAGEPIVRLSGQRAVDAWFHSLPG